MTKLNVIIASGSDTFCANCKLTEARLKKVINEKFNEVEYNIEHINVTAPESIQKFGALLSPALILNDVIVHEGGVPTEAMIERALKHLLR